VVVSMRNKCICISIESGAKNIHYSKFCSVFFMFHSLFYDLSFTKLLGVNKEIELVGLQSLVPKSAVHHITMHITFLLYIFCTKVQNELI